MKYTVEQTFDNLNNTCRGAGYRFYEDVFQDLIHMMVERIGRPFTLDDRYHRHLIFVMNPPFYSKFCFACAATCHDQDMYKGIRITLDKDLYICGTTSPTGCVRLIYEESERSTGLIKQYVIHDAVSTYELWTAQLETRPHIDHVKFNGPATIVFWKDGTKTVVKLNKEDCDDRRKAILYAFIRKIYGEGRPYHNILNEIERAIK